MSLKQCVIFVAGGRGLRMGADIPKQFMIVAGKPILMHTIENFLNWKQDIKVVLVLPEDHFPYWESLCREYNFTVKYHLAPGGDTRYQSVKNGLRHVGDSGLIAIHDGVRPFVSHQTIERCFNTAEKEGAAIPALEVVESLRKTDKNNPTQSISLERSLYRTVQTPQVFRASILREAYELPFNPHFTDDASVVEAAGHEISLVEGNRENIKITSPLDLKVAEALLA
ncbi:2-C-methyl-D-erythritol 4-phosphate cytidylyltransferase [Thermophagus sp. OGC60D27]|uniref:2-C-methyl-D-erythritol 4-phosphate cytidylyltransferase n=1 Tax=Thermophagus sp. OGC60D27 TaxID=3458415 RepID=UPI004037FF39